jgi:hypothetical protein
MAEDINFSDILNNPHFSQFVVLLRVAMSQHWRMRHPEVPSVRSTIGYRLLKLSQSFSKHAPSIRQDFLSEWTMMFASIVEADPKLYYRTEDVDWFLGVLDGEYASLTMSMLFAAASSKQSYLTPAQVAEATGDGESSWRKRCADGEIIGAFKAGKQWLIPTTSLRAYGVNVEVRGQEVDEEAIESD